MLILSFGNYFSDFHRAFSFIPINSSSVLELCFGDIYLAMLCRKNNIDWTGYDISQTFVDNANKNNLNAYQADLHNIKFDKRYDATIILRSLYHFKSDLDSFIQSILEASDSIIICESIKTFSNSRFTLLRWLARKLTHSGDSEHTFRYTIDSLDLDIQYLQRKFDLIIVRKKVYGNLIFYLIKKRQTINLIN
tara:strand:- start:756 stop:1334 length:579 start_codon:yes stop_codon:yes gene_type:complete